MPVKKVAKKMTTKQMKKTKGGAAAAMNEGLMAEAESKRAVMRKKR